MLRDKLLRLHTWAGLTVGLMIVFLAVTGAGFVLRPQLDRVFYGDMLAVQACAPESRRPLDELAAIARAAHPAGTVDQFLLPNVVDASWGVQFRNEDIVYLDPCSGRVLGTQNEYAGFFGTMNYLHRMRFLGPSGKLVAGWCAVAYILFLLIGGIYLWWPRGTGGWKSAFKFDSRRPGIARTLNLHKVVGLYSSVLLLAVAVMAMPIAFKTVNAQLYRMTGSHPFDQPPKVAVPLGGTPVPMESLWREAQAEIPDIRWALLRYPRKPDDAAYMEIIDGAAPHDEAKSYLYFDAYSGRIALERHYARDTPAGRKLYLWMIVLHSALWGGILYQSVLFVAALGMGVQAYSGFSPYLRRKLRRSGRAQLTLEVVRKTVVATDICCFELADPKGRRLPPFSAGSHIDVTLKDGMVRQYSLCNDPGDTHRYVIGVLRKEDGRGGSRHLHDEIAEGDRLAVGAPKNHFPLAHGARRSLLLAGGIGITPILCMAERLSNIGADFALHYCVKTPDRAAFLDRIRASAFAGRMSLHLSEGTPDQRLDLDALLAAEAEDTHIYVCGPTGFMDSVIEACRRKGWADSHVHREYFAGADRRSAQDAPFAVQIASTGKVVQVPKDRTVVEALADEGIEIATSCGTGVCGTCLTRVLDGDPDHRDMFQTAEELARNDQFTPCCSRARSPVLILDL